MRHRDDDLAKFRSDPVVEALTGPASANELAGEADAVAAYREAVSTTVPPQRGRSAARVVTGTTVAVLVLGVSGGVAAAYTAQLPDSWQQKLHDEVPALHIPAPHHHKSIPSTLPTPATTSIPSFVPTPTPAPTVTGGKPTAHSTPTASTTVATSLPTATSSVPVVLPSPTATASTTATPTPTSTSTAPPVVAGGQLQIRVTPGTKVPVGTALSVSGKLADADGNAVANRRVVLIERVPGEAGRHRIGSGRTSATGEVSISGPTAQRNLRLVLRAGHVHSPVQRVVVIPTLHVQVPATPAGATSVTVSVSVSGGQAGDVVVVRGPGAHDARRATLDSSLQASFTLPVSQTQNVHYRAFVLRTKAHAAHSLPFYVPASGG